MAGTQDVVLVCFPGTETRRAITAVLRDRWPVRTATTAGAAAESLDESISVIVLHETSDAVPESVISPAAEHRHVQVLWLGSADADVADHADAVLEPDPPEQSLQKTVKRLQQRARYDRLLSRFYELARSGSGADSPDSQTTDSEQELASLKRELDSLVAELDDEDAFEVALRVSDSTESNQ